MINAVNNLRKYRRYVSRFNESEPILIRQYLYIDNKLRGIQDRFFYFWKIAFRAIDRQQGRKTRHCTKAWGNQKHPQLRKWWSYISKKGLGRESPHDSLRPTYYADSLTGAQSSNVFRNDPYRIKLTQLITDRLSWRSLGHCSNSRTLHGRIKKAFCQ